MGILDILSGSPVTQGADYANQELDRRESHEMGD